mmetsp:Transcript_38925/g.70231  ORF Transcript_38925/g.70231 Transcript_38925/m.70231 type:complete len:87 (-) Transcript_38925:741-1001(-)
MRTKPPYITVFYIFLQHSGASRDMQNSIKGPDGASSRYLVHTFSEAPSFAAAEGLDERLPPTQASCHGLAAGPLPAPLELIFPDAV